MMRSSREFRCLSFAIALLAFPVIATAADSSGEQLYQKKCASCHGAKGEGTSKDYQQPLIGDRSLDDLTKYVAKSMPDDAPGSCTPEEAKKVSAYIYDAFYSPIAQARNKPARQELSRLTVRQYQQAVTDVLGSFRQPFSAGPERGLKGEYFLNRRFRGNEKKLDRVDGDLQFDFAAGSPVPGAIDPAEFGIRWQGSVLAPESGEFEFILRTDNGTRVWINNNRVALIDAWVRSGKDSEYRASLKLVGGHYYPIKIEYFKSKEGKEKRAAISLRWKRPQHGVELIPAKYLSPISAPEQFVVQAAFPPDDRSIGYERGTSISKAWDEATTEGAIEAAAYVEARLSDLSGVFGDSKDREARLREFADRLVARAFRHPLDAEERKFFVDRQFELAKDPAAAAKRVALLAFKSPRFLYREPGGKESDPYVVASRLSFGLWDSIPDQALLDAANSGKLATRDEVVKQAERMLPDPRTKAKLRELVGLWLKLDHLPEISKDSKLFPEFTPQVASDLRTSLDLFVDDVLETDGGDFRRFFLADSLYLNGPLAGLYGVDLEPDAPFQKVAIGNGERAGVVSHPFLMAGFAYTATSSPIHRGVFLSRNLLGRALRVPPIAVAPLPVDLHADLTTRERVVLQTKSEACQTCHAMINPLGFALEHYDALGRFRSDEKGKPIDAVGTYVTRGGSTASFRGAKELSGFLAGSDETHAAFVQQMFHHLVKQPIRAYGPGLHGELRQSFAQNGFQIDKLMVEIVARAALAK